MKALYQLFCDDPKPVSRAAARNFYAYFAEANERLRRLALPDRQAPLFDADFSAYPKQASPLGPPSHREAISIAVVLWRHRQQPRRSERIRRAVRHMLDMLRRRSG